MLVFLGRKASSAFDTSLLNKRFSLWLAVMITATLVLWLPLTTIVSSLLQPFSSVWQHLASTVLSDYVINSLLLMFGVAIGTFVLGVSSAWLTTMCQFPGRRWLSWALLLPMAMPAYIIAYTYTGMLDFSGPLQTSLRDLFQWRYGDYWFPEIRSLGGAVAMLSLVLYPYVYLIVRASFLQQSHALLEVSRVLGNGPWRTFISVAIPASRPAIVAGLTLALMETLADYGTVQYFGVSTFTTGIFRTWFGMGDLTAAAQLSSFLLLFVFALVVVERQSRSRMRFHPSNGTNRHLPRIPMTGLRGYLCFACCVTPLALGFILPAGQLLSWSLATWEGEVNAAFFSLVGNSFLLAATASLTCLILGMVLCLAQRQIGHRPSAEAKTATFTLRAATMGYAVPGTVIAVGVLIPFAAFDNTLDSWMRERFNISTGLVLSGSLAALVFAYVVRFISVSVQTIESGYSKIPSNVDDSARTLGDSAFGVFRNIHLPLLKTSLLSALLLVFVDVLKELPTTLILRPFNFNTLAVRAYELASDERLMDASTAALAIVIIGLAPVLLLTRAMEKNAVSEH